ncbi:hypothetical protein [Brevundimonas sp. SORGH_AS_0993]|uniref:hypothetical protein n=1 Tax=Brevundimonas sp. SORGH_AS_0993 TaxID=3041794 RepID=UPI002789FEBE|nr:hypothetical protein [Brevundimonas sp. SORGH_AS_0993]MDQ1155044.1 membrane-associated HD superfamily phosphohydrolase [Brevundimonas sp. SORGH_AS_0993]
MLIAIPLLIIPVALYNILVLTGGVGQADALLNDPLFSVTMTSGAQWSVSWGDLILFVGLILLFFELIKSTSSQRIAIVNHALSMVLFIAVLIEFLLMQGFATSTFFLIVVMILLDVLAGFIVTIIASRKDFDFGN